MGKILRSQPYRLLAVLLACLLCVSCVQPAFAANETAKTVQLMKTEGTVSVSNSSGKKVSLRDNMRLYNGYHVGTEDASYAWFNLDSTKLSKLDEVSEMELRKSGKKLELLLNSGDLFFNVTEPLASDETLNIHTSTMVAGIRGTCGWVRVIDQWRSRLYVLEGRVECTVTDPVTGQTKTTVLTGGEWAEFVVYDQSRAGDKCDIIRQRFSEGNIPGFVLVELVGDSALCEKIYADSGLDLRNMTASQAADRLRDDQAVTAQKISSIRKEQAEQDRNVSADPVWRDETPGGTAPSTTPSGGGTGSSGGNNTPNRPDRPSSGITDTTPTITQAVVMTMPVTIPQIQAALDPDSVTSVTVNPGAGDNTLVQNPGETLHVASGKTLTLANGVDLTENGTLNVDGTMTVNGDLINNGVITVTSPNSLHVNGRFVNNVSGQVRNIQNGHIVPAKGIENSGSISTTGSANLESAAEATVTMLDERASLTLNGGSISNTAAGSALRWENGKLPAADITGNDTTNIWTAGGAPLSAVVNGVEQTDIIPEGYKLVTNAGQTSLRPTGGVEGGVLVDPVTVSFDANGGRWSGTAPSITVERGETMGAQSAAPSREGYTFVDWRDAEGTLYTESSVITGSITLYAQWRASGGSEVPGEDEITVTFASEGAVVASIRIQRGGSLPYLPAAPERKGYVFQGWSGVQDTYAADTTLTALWQSESGAEPPEMVTVTFVSAGTVVLEAEVEKGGSLDYLPAPPLRSGYIFNGWSGALDAYDADTTVTALWRTESTYVPPSPPETVTVTFVSEEENVAVIELEKGDPLPYLPAVTRSGYVLSGWDGLQETYTADTTLTAVWVEEGGTVTVTFEPNLPEGDDGGEGTFELDMGDNLRYPPALHIPSDYGYELLGWSTTKTGIVTDSSGVTQFNDWDTPLTADLTLYGVWRPIVPTGEEVILNVMSVYEANTNPEKVQKALNKYNSVTIYADENGNCFSAYSDLLIPDVVTLHLAGTGETVATADGEITTTNAAWLNLAGGNLTVLGVLDIPGYDPTDHYSLRANNGSVVIVGETERAVPSNLLSSGSSSRGTIECGGMICIGYSAMVNGGNIQAKWFLVEAQGRLTNTDIGSISVESMGIIESGSLDNTGSVTGNISTGDDAVVTNNGWIDELTMYAPPLQPQSLSGGPQVNLLSDSEVGSINVGGGLLWAAGARIGTFTQSNGQAWLTGGIQLKGSNELTLSGGMLNLNASVTTSNEISDFVPCDLTMTDGDLYIDSAGSLRSLWVDGGDVNICGITVNGDDGDYEIRDIYQSGGSIAISSGNIGDIEQTGGDLTVVGGEIGSITTGESASPVALFDNTNDSLRYYQKGGEIYSLAVYDGDICIYDGRIGSVEQHGGEVSMTGGKIDEGYFIIGIPRKASLDISGGTISAWGKPAIAMDDLADVTITKDAMIEADYAFVIDKSGGTLNISGGTIWNRACLYAIAYPEGTEDPNIVITKPGPTLLVGEIEEQILDESGSHMGWDAKGPGILGEYSLGDNKVTWVDNFLNVPSWVYEYYMQASWVH